MPAKDIPKVSFVLLPYLDLLPSIASADGYATSIFSHSLLNAKCYQQLPLERKSHASR